MTRRGLGPVLFALAAVLAVSTPIVLALIAPGSGANFADSESFAGNRLGAGLVQISIDQASLDPAVAGRTQSRPGDRAVLSATNMAPGDAVSGKLRVENNGSLPFQYAVTATASPARSPLNQWLLYESWLGSTCEVGETTPRWATNLAFGDRPAAVMGRTTPIGDQFTLEPGDSVTVCIGARLPLTAPNEVQNAQVNIDLVISAVQALEQVSTLPIEEQNG